MKIRFNELPDGFEVKDGQVIESKQTGGTTGDQKNYGLVTGPQDEYEHEEIKVKYSMSAVPRDEANIEAEGGETVLTDLNGDGSFGLYDIKGSRHSNGGVPLYLPEQSFVFSDYNKMKLTKDEMNQLGVTSKKRLTPAKVSKKYGTNEYYASIKDPFADDIQVKSAEMMLDKNKMQLSKLAFMQEAKKDFEEGVPVTAFPYLVQTGHDPIEYTQQVEQITRQQAEQKLFNSLSPQEQMQVMAMQEYMKQVDQQSEPQQMPQQMAQYGTEFLDPLKDLYNNASLVNKLRKENFEPELLKQLPHLYENPNVIELLQAAAENLPMLEQMDISKEEYLDYINQAVYDLTGTATGEDDFFYNPDGDEVILDDPDSTRVRTTSSTSTSKPRRNPGTDDSKRNTAYDDAIYSDFYKKRNIFFEPVKIGARKYKDVQSQKSKFYGDAVDNIKGFEEWKGIYPGYDDLQKELQATKGQGELEEVGKFQKWFNDEYIPFFAKDWANNYVERNYTDENGNITIDPEAIKSIRLGVQKSLQSDFGFNPNQYGRAFDKKMGTFTSSRRPFSILKEPEQVEDLPLAPKYEPEQEEQEEKDELEVEPGEFIPQYGRNDPRFWLQDLIKINAVANRKRKKFYPWEPPVENVEVNWLLEDPTFAVNATNAQLNTMGDAIGAFTGPQSLNARMANAQGKAAANIANVIAGVHNRNINTTNKGLALQTQYDSYLNAERRKRQKSLYDNTQLVEQKYMNEKNFDREQMAGLVANAYTNAANTYNLNSLNDYYSIDPSTGGIINFDRGKNMAATKAFDQNTYTQQFINAYNKFVDETGEKPTDKIMEQLMKNQTSSGQTNLDAARQQYYNTNPLNVDYGRGRKGKEIKHKLLPFFIGAIGI